MIDFKSLDASLARGFSSLKSSNYREAFDALKTVHTILLESSDRHPPHPEDLLGRYYRNYIQLCLEANFKIIGVVIEKIELRIEKNQREDARALMEPVKNLMLAIEEFYVIMLNWGYAQYCTAMIDFPQDFKNLIHSFNNCSTNYNQKRLVQFLRFSENQEALGLNRHALFGDSQIFDTTKTKNETPLSGPVPIR